MEVDGKRVDTVLGICEPCLKGNISKQADCSCTVCEKCMCQICFRNHLMLNECSNPDLGALDGERRPASVFKKLEDKCKKHTTEIIKFYCRDHDFVGCGECFLFDHRKCELELIKDLAKNFEETFTFKTTIEKIDRLEDLKKELEIALEKNREENGEFHDKAKDEIKKQLTEVNTWLNTVTSKIETEEIDIWKENESVLSKLEDWIKVVGDMINEARDETNTEKFTGENLFIRVVACNSKLSDFTARYVPEIKSSLNIKYFALEPNKDLLVLTNLDSLCVVRIGNRNEEFQTGQDERRNNLACNNRAINVISSKVTEPEAELVCAEKVIVSASEDPVSAELEKELEMIRKTVTLEKEKNEGLQQSYNTLKKENEDQAALLSREREEKEKSILVTKELEQNIVVLNKEKSLNLSLESQIDNLMKTNEILKSEYIARQEQDRNKIISLQSEIRRIRENHEKECKRLSAEIRYLELQRDAAKKTYQSPNFKAENKMASEKSTVAEFTDCERTEPDKTLKPDTKMNIRDSKDGEIMQNSNDVLKTNLESSVLTRFKEMENCSIKERQQRQEVQKRCPDVDDMGIKKTYVKSVVKNFEASSHPLNKDPKLEDLYKLYEQKLKLHKNEDLHEVDSKIPSRNEKNTSNIYLKKPEQKKSSFSMLDNNFEEEYGNNYKSKSDSLHEKVPDEFELAAGTHSQSYRSMSEEVERFPTYKPYIPCTMKTQPKQRYASSTEKTCQNKEIKLDMNSRDSMNYFKRPMLEPSQRSRSPESHESEEEETIRYKVKEYPNDLRTACYDVGKTVALVGNENYRSMSEEVERYCDYKSCIPSTMKTQPKQRSASSTEKTCQRKEIKLDMNSRDSMNYFKRPMLEPSLRRRSPESHESEEEENISYKVKKYPNEPRTSGYDVGKTVAPVGNESCSSMSEEVERFSTYKSCIPSTMKTQPKQRSASSTEKTCQNKDPRTAGFDVDKRVALLGNESSLGIVTAVHPDGYVNVLWNWGEESTYVAGAKGQFDVKLLPECNDSS